MERNKLLSKSIAYGMFGFLGALFLFCFLTEKDLAQWGNLLWTGEYLCRTLGISLIAGGGLGAGIGFLFYQAAIRGFSLEGRKGKTESAVKNGDSPEDHRGNGKPGSGRVFCLGLGLTILAWFPAFLAYYPGICAYDTGSQVRQILEDFYIEHHPVAHTLLIKGAMVLGERVFGNVNAGIGCYASLQMLILASAFAFGMAVLWKRRVRRLWLVVIQLFCMLYPFHAYMSISVTKDTIFSSFFVISLISLCEMMDAPRDGKMKIVFFLSGVGMILFRNNGKYAFLVLLVCLGAVCLFGKGRRRFWGRLFLMAFGSFAAGIAALLLISRVVGAAQGDRREMLSIPIQQLARTMVYHGGVGVLEEDDDTMEDVEKALVNDFILNEAYREYRPDFADPVKSNTNTYVVRYRTGEFLETYLRLFLRYPGDFVNAVLAVNAGYLSPEDVSHAYVNAQEGQAPGGGYVQTRWEEGILNSVGIFKDSRWEALFLAMEKWADENAYLKVPVLKYFFVPGTVIWLYLLLLGWRLIWREFRVCIPFSLVFGYFLTLLLGPTVQLRYLYPLIIAFPFLLLWGESRAGCDGQEAGRENKID